MYKRVIFAILALFLIFTCCSYAAENESVQFNGESLFVLNKIYVYIACSVVVLCAISVAVFCFEMKHRKGKK